MSKHKPKRKRTVKPEQVTFSFELTEDDFAKVTPILSERLLNVADNPEDTERMIEPFLELGLTIAQFSKTPPGAVLAAVVPSLLSMIARYLDDPKAFEYYVRVAVHGINKIVFQPADGNLTPENESRRQVLH